MQDRIRLIKYVCSQISNLNLDVYDMPLKIDQFMMDSILTYDWVENHVKYDESEDAEYDYYFYGELFAELENLIQYGDAEKVCTTRDVYDENKVIAESTHYMYFAMRLGPDSGILFAMSEEFEWGLPAFVMIYTEKFTLDIDSWEKDICINPPNRNNYEIFNESSDIMFMEKIKDMVKNTDRDWINRMT